MDSLLDSIVVVVLVLFITYLSIGYQKIKVKKMLENDDASR